MTDAPDGGVPPTDVIAVGGIGDDGKFHFIKVDNTGIIQGTT